MVDPQIRLQNIALEHAELTARRSMTWAESTNRTAMFLSVVGAAVVALALFAQTGVAGSTLVLLALVIVSVVLLIGLSTLLRIGHLDEEDMRWIQGLNRLRYLRLELDPGLSTYLVTSEHDDFDSVIEAYATPDTSPVYAFGTLVVVLIAVNCVLVGFVGGLFGVVLSWDEPISLFAGVVASVAFLIAAGVWMYRGVRRMPSRLVTVVPAPRDAIEEEITASTSSGDGAAVDRAAASD